MFRRWISTLASRFRRSAPPGADGADEGGGEPAGDVENHRRLQRGKRFARLFAAACFLVVAWASSGRETTILWTWDPRDLIAWVDWVLQSRWVLGFVVISPFWISVLVSLSVGKNQRGDFTLIMGTTPRSSGVQGAAAQHEARDDDKRWRRTAATIETSWEYERERLLRSQHRRGLQALIFGDLATLALTCGVLALPHGTWNDRDTTWRLALSGLAATATAFVINLVRILLRASGGDVTTRTFAWASRTLALVIVADLGVHTLLEKEISGIWSALALGVFVGTTGSQAIQFLLDKGGKRILGTTETRASQARSPLLDIEGMTPEHVERLEEEGILSIHDLAFVPTARLFFATTYSLQQICDWQDRALLLVYVGKRSAAALAEKLGITGAIDLRADMHEILFNGQRKDVRKMKTALRKALHLDEGELAARIKSMVHDEATMRIRCYWGSTVAWNPPGRTSDRGDGAVVEAAAGTAVAAPQPAADAIHDVAAASYVPRKIRVLRGPSDLA